VQLKEPYCFVFPERKDGKEIVIVKTTPLKTKGIHRRQFPESARTVFYRITHKKTRYFTAAGSNPSFI
jgi:hypothetical protein